MIVMYSVCKLVNPRKICGTYSMFLINEILFKLGMETIFNVNDLRSYIMLLEQ